MEINSHLLDGTLLQGGKYRIVRFIGQGGFGCTYEAHFEMLNARVAIKEFFPQEMCNRDATGHVSTPTDGNRERVSKMRRKFVDEARTLYKYKDIDGIVKVADIFEENGTAYFVMDFIDGRSVQSLIDSRGRLPEAEALDIIRRVGRSLRAVHALGSLHLDIKPDNIMMGADGAPVLIDFGVSKQFSEEDGCNTSTLMGYTPGFAPLEQMNSNVQSFSPATDVYALGATLYAMLTGKRPPKATDLLNDVEALAFPDDISSTTRRAIEAAMEPKVKHRPQSVADFLAMLPGGLGQEHGGKNLGQEHVGKNFGQEHRGNSSDTDIQGFRQEHRSNRSHSETQLAGGDKDGGLKKYLVVALAAAVAALAVVLGWKMFNRLTPPPADNPIAVTDSNTFTVNGVSFKMIPVAGGSFMMGSNDGDSDEKPVHSETVGSFRIGETEVTQALWKAVMGENPSYFNGDNLPVENVSWDECQTFISKLNELTGKRFRLPTEAEWEYAARGGQRSNGYKYSGSDNIESVAWYAGNTGSKTHPVAKKQHNELGIYDMSGNVWEWTSDKYSSDYSSPRNGSNRVYRGGSWLNNASRCRSAIRCSFSPGCRFNFVGLRLAL